MEFFKIKTHIPFMKQRKLAGSFSVLIFIASMISLMVYGLTLGLDFTGGTTGSVQFSQPFNLNEVRVQLQDAGFPEALVQTSGKNELTVRVGPHEELSTEQLKVKLEQAMPHGKLSGSLEYLGPQVGKQLMTNGILAVVVALLATIIYIALRFEMRFAVSAAVALIHDPVLILGIFSFWHIEFNMIVLTAVLTVIGYSLNDTIVVYDRVRENFRNVRKKSPSELMDLSINQTLSRTIMTSSLTLTVVIALFLYGGDVVHGFALALIIGIVIGTYSSIYVAGSLAIALGLTRESLMSSSKRIVDNLP